MTFIDFFAGVGGFRRGLELAGHKCLGFCEQDKFAVKSYRAIHDTEGEWFADDIRTVRAADIPRADIWCAGFPCQDISLCGKRLGFRGKRSSLFFTVTSLIKDLDEENRPVYLFFENVKNILSVNRGFDFARLLVELDEIGYNAEWATINSSDLVPQNRERVFIIGHNRKKRTQQIFPLGESLEICSGRETARQVHRDISATLTAKAQQNWTGTFIAEPTARSRIYQKPRGKNGGGVHDIAPTLTANHYERNNYVIQPSTSKRVVKQVANVCPTSTRDNPNQGRVYDTSGIAPTLNCMGGGNREPRIIVPCKAYGLYTQESPDFMRKPLAEKSRSLKANKHDAGVIIYEGEECYIRLLTPLECWRLQGWNDEEFFRAFFLDKKIAARFNAAYQRHIENPVRLMEWAFKYQKQYGTSDHQLYKQAGNGVTVTVIAKIAKYFREEGKE